MSQPFWSHGRHWKPLLKTKWLALEVVDSKRSVWTTIIQQPSLFYLEDPSGSISLGRRTATFFASPTEACQASFVQPTGQKNWHKSHKWPSIQAPLRVFALNSHWPKIHGRRLWKRPQRKKKNSEALVTQHKRQIEVVWNIRNLMCFCQACHRYSLHSWIAMDYLPPLSVCVYPLQID